MTYESDPKKGPSAPGHGTGEPEDATTQNLESENAGVEPAFDEAEFLRKARWRGFWRTLLIALGVVVGAFVLLVVIPETLLQRQENHLNLVYPRLIRLIEPNTDVIVGESYKVRWLVRHQKYYLFRLLGDTPRAAGTLILDFKAWGWEQIGSQSSFAVTDPSDPVMGRDYPGLVSGGPVGSKRYLVPYAVPALEFYHPAALYEEQPGVSYVRNEFGVLDSIPKDHLVEMALSFSRVLTAEEVQALVPSGARLMWGAVCSYDDQQYQEKPHLTSTFFRNVVGNPWIGTAGGDEKFVEEMERLGQYRSWYSGRYLDEIRETVAYAKEHGVRYYGAVVVGTPDVLMELSGNEAIRGAVVGIVTPPR